MIKDRAAPSLCGAPLRNTTFKIREMVRVLPALSLLWFSLFPFPTVSLYVASPSYMLGQATRLSVRAITKSTVVRPSVSRLFMSTEPRKAGVATPEELKAFVQAAGDRLMVVDVRNPDPAVEPGDQKSLAVAPLPSDSVRPKAVHLIWDRTTDSMPLPPTDDMETPIITHCGGGGRGQKAKDYLTAKGFTNILNGGGPKETDCWSEFGDK